LLPRRACCKYCAMSVTEACSAFTRVTACTLALSPYLFACVEGRQGPHRMNPRGKKLEPKLGLNMPFAELVERLMQTDPKEVERSIEKAKQEKPPDVKRRPKRRE